MDYFYCQCYSNMQMENVRLPANIRLLKIMNDMDNTRTHVHAGTHETLVVYIYNPMCHRKANRCYILYQRFHRSRFMFDAINLSPY